MKGPELTTRRLELSWLTLDDTPLMFAVWNDPAFVRHVADRGIRTLEHARAAVEAGPLRLYAEHGYGPFRVRRRVDGVDMGICGLSETISPAGDGGGRVCLTARVWAAEYGPLWRRNDSSRRSIAGCSIC
jgi:hypothetical protein